MSILIPVNTGKKIEKTQKIGALQTPKLPKTLFGNPPPTKPVVTRFLRFGGASYEVKKEFGGNQQIFALRMRSEISQQILEKFILESAK